jgi:hypothetical protein
MIGDALDRWMNECRLIETTAQWLLAEARWFAERLAEFDPVVHPICNAELPFPWEER